MGLQIEIDLPQMRRDKDKREKERLMDSFQLAFMGDKYAALQRYNEGRPKDKRVTDLSIDEKTGDFTVRDAEGNESRMPYERIFIIQALEGKLKPTTPRGAGKAPKVGAFEVGAALNEMNQYLNLDQKTVENPDGITAEQRRAIINALEVGITRPGTITYADIAQNLGLQRRLTNEDAEAARIAWVEAEQARKDKEFDAKDWGVFPPRLTRVSKSEQRDIDELKLMEKEAKSNYEFTTRIAQAPLETMYPRATGLTGIGGADTAGIGAPDEETDEEELGIPSWMGGVRAPAATGGTLRQLGGAPSASAPTQPAAPLAPRGGAGGIGEVNDAGGGVLQSQATPGPIQPLQLAAGGMSGPMISPQDYPPVGAPAAPPSWPTPSAGPTRAQLVRQAYEAKKNPEIFSQQALREADMIISEFEKHERERIRTSLGLGGY